MKQNAILIWLPLILVLTAPLTAGWLPKLYLGPADTSRSEDPNITYRWTSAFLQESPDSGVLYFTFETAKLNYSGIDTTFVRFGQVYKNVQVWEDTFVVTRWDSYGMEAHPFYTMRKPGFGHPGEEVAFGFYSQCAVDYSTPPENNGFYFFTYKDGELFHPPANTFWYRDSCLNKRYPWSTSFLQTETAIWVYSLYYWPPLYAPMLVRVKDSCGTYWSTDTFRVWDHPTYCWWSCTDNGFLIPGTGDTSLVLYLPVENACPDDYSTRWFEAHFLGDGSIIWDTIGVYEPFMGSGIEMYISGNTTAYSDGAFLGCLRGPGLYYYTYFYRDSAGCYVTASFLLGDFFTALGHRSLCIGLGDSVGIVWNKHSRIGDPLNEIYYAVGRINELEIRCLGENNCRSSGRMHSPSPDCAFDRDGNFYVAWWTRDDFPDAGPWIKCLVPPDTVSGISERVLPENKDLRIYPNPFNESCRIVSKGGEVSIYDLNGKRVFEKRQTKEFVWKGIDEEGKELPSGVYLVKDELGNSKKVIMLK